LRRAPRVHAPLSKAACAVTPATSSGSVTPRDVRAWSLYALMAMRMLSVPPLVMVPQAPGPPLKRRRVIATTSDSICGVGSVGTQQALVCHGQGSATSGQLQGACAAHPARLLTLRSEGNTSGCRGLDKENRENASVMMLDRSCPPWYTQPEMRPLRHNFSSFPP